MCGTDPLLDHIRTIYGAVPMRMPEPRIQPYTIFADIDGRSRFLGHLSDIATDKAASLSKPAWSALPDMSATRSRTVSIETVMEVTGPFLAAALQVPLAAVEAALVVENESKYSARLGVDGSSRHYLNPLQLGGLVEQERFGLPATIGRQLSDEGHKLYLVDSTLISSGIVLELEGSRRLKLAAKLEQSLAGRLKPETLYRTESSLLISGAMPTTFAFTCLAIHVDSNGSITDFALDNGPRVGATSAALIGNVEHQTLGEDDEMFMMDD